MYTQFYYWVCCKDQSILKSSLCYYVKLLANTMYCQNEHIAWTLRWSNFHRWYWLKRSFGWNSIWIIGWIFVLAELCINILLVYHHGWIFIAELCINMLGSICLIQCGSNHIFCLSSYVVFFFSDVLHLNHLVLFTSVLQIIFPPNGLAFNSLYVNLY